jgi:hypothetical protein
MTTITLKDIKTHQPCTDGWLKLLKHLGKTKCDDEPLSLITILDSNGLEDAFWCLRVLPKEMDGKIRLFNCLLAERALQFWEKYYPNDNRPHEAIAVARKFAVGEATQQELDAPRVAALDAARVVGAAGFAARAAARAAGGIVWGAWDAACAALCAVIWDAAGGVAGAVTWRGVCAAANAAANAAGDAERKAQEELFREYWKSQPAEKGE